MSNFQPQELTYQQQIILIGIITSLCITFETNGLDTLGESVKSKCRKYGIDIDSALTYHRSL